MAQAGEVYKARDTRLDRVVAINVVPAHVANDPDLKERFEREARTVAAVNHPHICVLADFREQCKSDHEAKQRSGREARARAMSLTNGLGIDLLPLARQPEVEGFR